MQIGDSLTLTATMQPANAPDDLVSWASSDPNIATVKKGIVVATSSGSVTITVTSAVPAKVAASRSGASSRS